jgi:hypothetical protein
MAVKDHSATNTSKVSKAGFCTAPPGGRDTVETTKPATTHRPAADKVVDPRRSARCRPDNQIGRRRVWETSSTMAQAMMSRSTRHGSTHTSMPPCAASTAVDTHCRSEARDPATIDRAIGVEPDDVQRMLTVDADTYRGLGVTAFTLGVNGPPTTSHQPATGWPGATRPRDDARPDRPPHALVSRQGKRYRSMRSSTTSMASLGRVVRCGGSFRSVPPSRRVGRGVFVDGIDRCFGV